MTLVCAAFPFGYGPAAKLLHLAGGLRAAGFRLAFAGVGVAHELAARSEAFDEVLHATAGEARPLVRSAAGVLSLMDRDFAELAAAEGKPLFVADSLLWMRDRVPPAFRGATRYWSQAFAGEEVADFPVTAVGPIVAPLADAAARPGPPVVNLGGCASPAGGAADDASYFDFVARGLGEADPRAVLLAGAGGVAYLRGKDGRRELASAAHGEALTRLSAAPWVLTCPGLTATLECFQRGVPTYFLPPQNYSQWCVLARLRTLGLAPASFHWADVLPAGTITERMPEAGRGQAVRAAIRCAAEDPRAFDSFRAACAAAKPDAELARRQRLFFNSLGPNGVERIVADLCELC